MMVLTTVWTNVQALLRVLWWIKNCAVRLILKGQHFKYDSAELSLKAKELRDGVAKDLKAFPQKNEIEVQGHASSERSDSYNLKLSTPCTFGG